jgi:hypothetical protein
MILMEYVWAEKCPLSSIRLINLVFGAAPSKENSKSASSELEMTC